jgi:hypothetical protein
MTRRQFLTTGALAGAGLLSWPVRTHGQPTPTNLTGAWHADDGGIYYIRHFEDNSIWWAGLHNSGTGCEKPAFHLGVRFTNVFRGAVNMDNQTIEGSWADVPRGSILQHGQLSLSIETPSSGIELRQNPTGTTGGFGGRVWKPCTPFPHNVSDIKYRYEHVRRGHSQFSDDNWPFKDFAVAFGVIAENPFVLNWVESLHQPNYCNFVNEALDDHCFNPETGETDGCDGDLTFSIYAPRYDDPQYDANFWKTGWLKSPFPLIDSSSLIQKHLPSSGNKFHCEVTMFGRTNNEHDCAVTPNVLLPGWMETEGNSVLLNGRPINGALHQSVLGSDWQAEVLGKRLKSGLNVRLTGVINLDEHALKNDQVAFDTSTGTVNELLLGRGAPEVHPVYSIDVLQNFELPRPDADLTGVWHCDDVGTYYMHQVGNTVWWLGLSRDQGGSFSDVFQGGSFANVFQGTIDHSSIRGEWADIPMSVEGARSRGRLGLTQGIGTSLPNAWALGAFEETGGFGGSRWRKLYDWPDPFFGS